MPVCAVKLCRNYVGKCNKNTKITFHRFPSDPILADRWREIIQETRGEEYWKPHKTSVVCSQHFLEDALYFTKKGFRKLNHGAVPSKRLFLSGTERESSPKIKQEPPASTLEIDNQIKPRPSGSEEMVNLKQSSYNMDEEPTTISEDFSDLESVCDTPLEVKLRRELRRKIISQRKHKNIIKALRSKNVRLEKQNTCYKYIINTLIEQKLVSDNQIKTIKRNYREN